jgi:hypothetical protein
MAYGYFTDVAEAQTYFTDERLETSAWDAIAAGKKPALLMQGYNRIYYSKEFILPTLTEATVDELPVLQKAQAEMSYYLAMHIDDEDRRKGLQAQATTDAGIIKESYDNNKLYDTPIPPFVRDLLCAYLAGDEGIHFGAIDIGRDEEESVNEDVTDF